MDRCFITLDVNPWYEYIKYRYTSRVDLSVENQRNTVMFWD